MLTKAVPKPATRGRGRPTADAVQAREQDILQAAGSLFEQRGFAGVAMAEVARLARISKTTLYARYPNKESLFRAICSYACRVPAARIAAVSVTDKTPTAIMVDFATAIVAATADQSADRFLRLAIFESPRFPALADQILLESRAVAAPLVSYLTGLAHEGRLPGHDPTMLAAQFVALVTGGHDGLLERRDADTDHRVAAALALIMPAIDPAA